MNKEYYAQSLRLLAQQVEDEEVESRTLIIEESMLSRTPNGENSEEETPPIEFRKPQLGIVIKFYGVYR